MKRRQNTLRILGCALALTAPMPTLAQVPQAALVTESERSGFLRTGHYAEVSKLNAAFAKTYPRAVRAFTFGTTAEGRPLHALVVTRTGALTPALAHQRGLPVVL